MATRLDRIFLLLDTGSTTTVRRSAAAQLGQVQKLHPHELNNLLVKVRQYLLSPSWDTRIAAGQAVEAIAQQVPVHTDRPDRPESTPANETPPGSRRGKWALTHFNISNILDNAQILLSCEEDAFEADEISEESLERHRQMLNKRLGLDMGGASSDTTSQNLIKAEDFVGQEYVPKQLKVTAEDVMKSELSSSAGTDSNCRVGEEPSYKKIKTESLGHISEGSPGEEGNIVDPNNMDSWPFEVFCDTLLRDLFSHKWETRHGAATGLRELLRIHAAGAGTRRSHTRTQATAANEQYLEDTALRLLCTLALDRFGDFVSDEVVAPVRETCSQCLSLVLREMNASVVQGVLRILLALLSAPVWEVRHGGLLGLKCLLAVRTDLHDSVLPQVFEPINGRLKDSSDDVRASAAASLIPACHKLVETLPDKVPSLIDCLWHALLDLDDLNSSTSSVLALLSALIACPSSASIPSDPDTLEHYIPRLWPFLWHSITSVREAALQTIEVLLRHSNRNPKWLTVLLQQLLRHIYQRALLEDNRRFATLLYTTWSLACDRADAYMLITSVGQWLSIWLSLMMQPVNAPFDSNYMLGSIVARTQGDDDCDVTDTGVEHQYIAGRSRTDADVIRSRLLCSRMLGYLVKCITEDEQPSNYDSSPAESINGLLLFHLSSASALQRFGVCLVIIQWATLAKDCIHVCSESLKSKVSHCLSEQIYYDEIALMFTKLQTECKQFIQDLKEQNINIGTAFHERTVLTVEQAQHLVGALYESLEGSIPRQLQSVYEQKRQSLVATVNEALNEQAKYNLRVQSSLAGVLITLELLPDKLNPVVRPLMDSLKREENEQLQRQTASFLTRLLDLCLKRQPAPNSKIIRNICSLACSDPRTTPSVKRSVSEYGKFEGIITLIQTRQPIRKKTRGRAPKKPPSIEVDPLNGEQLDFKQVCTQKRGAVSALIQITEFFGDHLKNKVPALWESAVDPSRHLRDDGEQCDDASAQKLVNSLQIFEIIVPYFHRSLKTEVMSLLPLLTGCLGHAYTASRHMAARSLAVVCKVHTEECIGQVLDYALPTMESDTVIKRQGAVEVFMNTIEVLGIDIVPYISLMIVPVLGRMSDQIEATRRMATQCFANLVRLMPLEGGKTSGNLREDVSERKHGQTGFLDQLMHPGNAENYAVPVPVKVELRKYQKDGVNWLAFLNKYNLHGILCDDMGLGKTLQSICILAGDHYQRAAKHEGELNVNAPSIVVCPPTLTGHWLYEVEKFVSKQHLNPLHYTGPPAERLRLRNLVSEHNLVVASYDIVRNDLEFFEKISWNYCILDEGHIIKKKKVPTATLR